MLDHHRHVGTREEPYLFSTVRQLVADFMTGHARLRKARIPSGCRALRATFPEDNLVIPKRPREEVGFTSIEAARNFLTRERLTLLRTIRTRHPSSLYELAKIVDRDFENVQEDIQILERHGLVQIAKEPRGRRKVKAPRVTFDEIALRIAI